MQAPNFSSAIEKLAEAYGKPNPPAITDPFEMVLHENVAYLVNDEHRTTAFENLKTVIGTRPEDILNATPEQFAKVRELAGSDKKGRIQKLIRSAEIVRDHFGGDLKQVFSLPFRQARAALMKFPSIGEPGAEKILMYNRVAPVLALDSNGLRVLVRVGYTHEQHNYSVMYPAAQRSVADEQQHPFDPTAAYQLLRQHGQTICRRTDPQCNMCA